MSDFSVVGQRQDLTDNTSFFLCEQHIPIHSRSLFAVLSFVTEIDASGRLNSTLDSLPTDKQLKEQIWSFYWQR